ncbi:MAG: LOG family protein [Chloroflexi bacterium]|nr:LOG family protein [Chloroflexota bacterium]
MKRVSVFGSGQVKDGDPDYVEAHEMGRLLAESGYAVTSGGYLGAMEAVSRGAKEGGGTTRGITMTIFDPRPANPWVDEEEKVIDFFIRLEKLIHGSDAYVVLRGGIGTLVELSLAWSLLQTNCLSPRPLVVVGDAWAALFESFRRHAIVRERDWQHVQFVQTPAEALALIDRHFKAQDQ